jgi:diaminopimelate decarboxylase
LNQQYGGSFYVLDDARFENNFLSLQSAFRAHYPNTWIGYSYKTNYTPVLCALVDRLGGYAEVVSEMEYELAERLGVPPTRTIFNGPMKSPSSLRRALLGGSLVNLDSMRDLGMLSEIASNNPQQSIEVAIRCNFPLRSAFVSRFGFDVEGDAFKIALATIDALPNVDLVGLHCHFPDRDLTSYRTRVTKMLELCEGIFGDAPPKYLNVGGGYFSNMPAELKETFGAEHVSFEEYADALARPVAEAFGAGAGAPKLFLEPGTALVADALHFFARVADIKHIGNSRFATVDGSIFNISASARKTNLPIEVIQQHEASQQDAPQPTDIVGYTCIEGDCLTRAFAGSINVDDFVHYSNIGSYSVVMKPPFILPNVAIIRFDDKSGEPRLVKAAENFDNVFSTFVFEQ